jgi:DNA-binding beta-propeller fold protein YncE
MQMNSLRNSSRTLRTVLAGLLWMGLSASAFAGSQYYPTYTPGPLGNDTWVVGNGQIITPAGTMVNLMVNESSGTGVRAKAIALNPVPLANGHYTAAVLTMGATTSFGPVQVFDVTTGTVLQSYYGFKDKHGSSSGIVYTSDGKYLLYSQDSSYIGIANVSAATGLLSDYAQVKVPMDVDANGYLTTVTCFSNSPPGTTGSAPIPCGQTVTLQSDGTYSSYPLGIALTADNKTAYAVLDNNDTLTKIDLTQNPPKQIAEVRVGNVPNSVVISADSRTAYVSNEAGRVANQADFQEYSNGTPVVANYPSGSIATATISVVDLASFTVRGTISLTGLHPTGMALWGQYLLVADTYSDVMSVIDTNGSAEVRKINLALPIGVPSKLASSPRAYGAAPNSIAVDSAKAVAYVALYNANAVAVVDLSPGSANAIKGMIPVGYAPSSVVLDSADNMLIVANDKGIGTENLNLGTNCTTYYSVCGFNSHQDEGTVSIVPIPDSATLAQDTQQVFMNNHWDLALNIASSTGGNPNTPPVAIPAKIGDPSFIKHVFVIVRENRTYDQILGDVAAGNGDPTLAVFGGIYTPNAHTLVQRFPLLDNFYDPSRQSADGHNWIVQAMAPYSDDIQSPDWLRDYPSNGGDALAYQTKGNLYTAAAKAGVKLKNYGEYIEYNLFSPPGGGHSEPSWCQFYDDTVKYESNQEDQLYYYNTVSSYSPLPDVIGHTVQNYPQFDTGIPDQFRVDIWEQDFANDVAANNVPQLEFMWISSDHTGGPPNAMAMQADNDLALGRFIDIITHSSVWPTSAIFVEEDDAQNGVDHVDGHRSPGYVISPYVDQNGPTDHTFYTQVNMTRTIEQILGITPMNQFDLWASQMRTIFTDNPPQENFQPWTHVPAEYSLTSGTNCSSLASAKTTQPKESPKVAAMRAAWLQAKLQIFAGKQHKPDSEDPNTVAHYNWYEATGFTRPFPGEKAVRPPSDFGDLARVPVDKD